MSSIYYDILKLLVATFMAIITTYLNYYNIIPQIGGGRSDLSLAGTGIRGLLINCEILWKKYNVLDL